MIVVEPGPQSDFLGKIQMIVLELVVLHHLTCWPSLSFMPVVQGRAKNSTCYKFAVVQVH